MGSSVPLKERWFQDYRPGERFEFGDRLVSAEEIVEFARRYDPQPFHVDADAAAQSHFGGLIASGWMSTSLLMCMLCEHFISPASAMGTAGIDDLRWLRPVRPGDRVHARVTVVDMRRSKSKPDRGTVTFLQELVNQRGEVVMAMKALSLHRCRE